MSAAEDFEAFLALSADPDADPEELLRLRGPSAAHFPWTDLLEVSTERRGRQWFAEGAIEGTPITVLSGPEKKGKSWAAMQLAVATVIGGLWLEHWPIVRPGGVIYLESEYGPHEFSRRISRIARGMGVDPHVPLAVIRHAYSNFITLTEKDKAIQLILQDIEHNPPALVILDPLRNHIDGSENDSDAIIDAFRTLAMIREAAAAPVLVLHHLNKGGSVSGSRAVATRADLILEGTDTESPTFTARGRYLRSEDSILEPFAIEMSHEHDGDDERAITRVVRSAGGSDKDLRKKLLRALKEPHTQSWLKKHTNASGARIKEELGRLIEEGWIVECDVTVQNRLETGFIRAEGGQ